VIEERRRLQSSATGRDAWKHWGPYVSERQWGTVREDYSQHGNAWEYFPHEHARSRAYRWGEDGIAGLCDIEQRLVLSLALWNGRDRMLKERLFGLTNSQGNHGEDVKEQYFYLDATPSNSYLRMLYKYPQRAFPYEDLVAENARRGRGDPEFELSDTGAFDERRYFDVFVEYAQAAPGDILMRISAHNRGPDAAPLHLIPQLVLRNTWAWREGSDRPRMDRRAGAPLRIEHESLGVLHAYAEGGATWLMTDNDSNPQALWQTPAQGFFKDGFHQRIVDGRREAVRAESGTKAGAWHAFDVPPGGQAQVRLRLCAEELQNPFEHFDAFTARRLEEADEFYAELQAGIAAADARLVQRQAFAGLLWSKQFYNLDVPQWLKGDPTQPPPPPERSLGRNAEWLHLNNAEVISMPDKWEYPWYAAWDLAFHCIPLALIDAEFAKQ
jgi:hypothetical protein